MRSRLRRSRWEKPDPFLSLADLTLHRDTREVYRCQRLIELTAKEFDLLAFFMAHPHQVLSRRQILDQVWADTVNVTTNVVDSAGFIIGIVQPRSRTMEFSLYLPPYPRPLPKRWTTFST